MTFTTQIDWCSLALTLLVDCKVYFCQIFLVVWGVNCWQLTCGIIFLWFFYFLRFIFKFIVSLRHRHQILEDSFFIFGTFLKMKQQLDDQTVCSSLIFKDDLYEPLKRHANNKAQQCEWMNGLKFMEPYR